ncbi:dolichyl-phosphate-mannose--protein mannosyltransferase, partial [Aeromicrobium sp.]|uniref:dolichyl-phosphate-mannose--protein mannosyltransferase n=1 Tax=Aeromicrobium sp. TaxID=1871063 RepID=UPI003D6AB712
LSDLFIDGQPSQIVHPEAGKWLIALGEAAFGMDSFGWRVSAAVIGALTVLVLARLVRRLTGSTVIGCLAGLLLALDGVHLVLSRLALLDVFLTFWIVCAVACLVADHDWITKRLDRYRVLRPWQLLAGVCFGLACGTKWSGLYVLAVFGLAAVAWEVVARRRHGRSWLTSTLAVGVPAFVTLVGVAALVYVATWTGWLLNADVYEQRFGLGHGDEAPWGAYVKSPSAGLIGHTWDALRSLWSYHQMSYHFHTGAYLAAQTHDYQSQAWGWLVLDRPVSVAVQLKVPAVHCGAPSSSSCLRETLILGNPAVWWPCVVASVGAVAAWIAFRDWRWSVPTLGLLATWAPWLLTTNRPIFSFYAVASLPFMIIALCLFVDLARRRLQSPRGRYGVWLGAGILVTAVVIAFWFFFPIWTYELLPYDSWHDRMWFDRWI